jgi:nucleotide-binding universal stress UspA family protein
MAIARILIATDFSPAGERALRAAASLARREKAALRVVHVAPPARWLTGLWGVGSRAVEGVYVQAHAALKRMAEDADPTGDLEISTGFVRGPAASRIAAAVSEFSADLLVIGARGEHEGTAHQPGVLGGTAAKLLARAQVPLLLVRRMPSDKTPTVLAAVDLSPVSNLVLEWAQRCAVGGALHVLHAFEVLWSARLEAYGLARGAVDSYAAFEDKRRRQEIAALTQMAEGVSGPAILLEHGEPAKQILEQILRIGATLVVLGKHGRRARAGGAQHGSVCQNVAFHSSTDVLVVPPP